MFPSALKQSPGVTHLPWLMLTLLILLAKMAVFVSVSITWSLCRTTSPWEESPCFRVMALVSLYQNYPTLRDRGQGERAPTSTAEPQLRAQGNTWHKVTTLSLCHPPSQLDVLPVPFTLSPEGLEGGRDEPLVPSACCPHSARAAQTSCHSGC